MRYLRQSTSVDLPIGPFVSTVDGFTAMTALTVTQPDIRLKKNGAAWAQKNAAQTLSHEENGYYEVTLDATDTATLGQLRLAVNESTAMPIYEDFMVMPANVWDSMFASDRLQVDVQEMAASVQTEVADSLLKRDLSAVTGEASRSVLNAIRAIRNKVTIAAGTMTVKKEDDTTTAWTAAVTTTAGNPISEIDPT